jgi:hypothetical protein
MLDNVRAEYKSLQNVIKKLKEKLSKREQWKYRYFWNDGEQDLYEDVK